MAGEEPFRDIPGHASSNDAHAEPQPTEADVVGALADIERASTPPPEPSLPQAQPASGWTRHKFLYSFLFIYVLAGAGIWLSSSWKFNKPSPKAASSVSRPRPSDPAMQSQAESLLQRAVNGDASAANEVLASSNAWVGKTTRTPNTEGLVTSGINSANMHVREAAIQAAMAFDGIAATDDGFEMVRSYVGNPQRRAWALWTLGGLGNRGIKRDWTAKILGDYLLDPDASIRASAVDGMSLLATDEVIPLMLDRFRSDPSPLVQERAACGLAQSGMFTQQQRRVAAATMVGWTDDQLLSAQQRNWVFQALRDITGQNFGTDSNAWHNWFNAAGR